VYHVPGSPKFGVFATSKASPLGCASPSSNGWASLLPELGVSQQNLLYYASLANFYTVHDLRHLKADQAHLYLLCYAWQRYRQLSDNLVDAMAYHMKQLEEESSAGAQESFVDEQVRRQQGTPQVGRLLLLYVDDAVADADSLMAVIIAQAMNHGNQVMARTSDIPYHVLERTYQQHLRQASLHAANDCISNAIAALPIFLITRSTSMDCTAPSMVKSSASSGQP
jgi:hypothetical protein